MPIMGTTISQQNTAYSGGVHFYPNIAQTSQYGILGDSFQRESLTPANAYTLYTTTLASTGTVAIPSSPWTAKCSFTTAATNNDYVSFRTSGICVIRIAPDTNIDARNVLNGNFVFAFPTGGNTSAKMFIGLVKSNAGLTALPGTTKSIGVYIDTSVDANIYLTASNGTTQRTKSMGVSAANTYYRLNFVQTADNSLTLNLFSSSTYGNINTSLGSLTVTDAGYDDVFQVHGFIQSLAVASKVVDLYAWSSAAS